MGVNILLTGLLFLAFSVLVASGLDDEHIGDALAISMLVVIVISIIAVLTGAVMWVWGH